MTRVLLVEDEMFVRMLAEEELAELGCTVTSAASGDEAHEIIRQGAQFDVLVTDIRMPGQIDGWALALLAREAMPGIAIVYASGFSGDTHEPIPGSQFLKKPYRSEQLHEALQLSGT